MNSAYSKEFSFLDFFHQCGIPGILVEQSTLRIISVNDWAIQILNAANIDVEQQMISMITHIFSEELVFPVNNYKTDFNTFVGHNLGVQCNVTEVYFNNNKFYCVLFQPCANLKNHEFELHKLLHQVPVAMFNFLENGVMVFQNKSFTEVLSSKTLGEASNIFDFISNANADIILSSFSDFGIKTIIETIDEQTLQIIAKKVPKRNYCMAIVLDISDQFLIKKSLNENENLLDLAKEAAKQHFWKIDIKTRMMNFIGKTFDFPNEIANKTEISYGEWVIYIHEEDRKKTERQFEKYVQGKIDLYQVEYRFLTNTGEYIWLLSTGKAVSRNKNGIAEIMVGSHLNIDHLRSLELELLDKNKEIEKQNHELQKNYNEIKKINAELLRSKEKAEESDRLKTAFLQNMSHELRTPMNGIIGFSQLLNIPNLDSEKQKEYIEVINESSMQLLHIVNDIMDISKIETEQLRLRKESKNINKILRTLYDFFKPQADKLGLDLVIHLELADEDTQFETDEDKLKSIFNNLISNALKYTHQGKVEFGYKNKNKELTFFVKDTGIGIKPELHHYIFQRFSQAHPDDATKKYGGNGLGLAICKGMVDLFNGEIWVDSSPGNGSVFYFNLEMDWISKSGAQTVVQELKVMVAEDEDNNYFYLLEILDGEPYQVFRAENGKVAVEMVAKEHFDVILMDLRMPVMDGVQATRKIKELFPGIYIIAQTAYALSGDKKLAFDAGCDDYISKPINGVILKRILKNYVNSRKPSN